MSDIIDQVLPLLERDATAADWEDVLDDEVFFETLNLTLQGKADVAEKLASSPFSTLTWGRSDIPGVAVHGVRAPGTRDREFLLLIMADQGKITRFSQQNVTSPPQPETPLQMDDEMRAQFDGALAGSNPFSMSYVDEQNRPHLSLRGSVLTFGPDRLAMWARSSSSGIVPAIAQNPNVALLFRNPAQRATYQLRGRAYVANDDETRRAVYDQSPLVERQHDFAMLGAAVIIELDLIEGWAGFGPQGVIGAVRMVRPTA
jgi:hypothetical protein